VVQTNSLFVTFLNELIRPLFRCFFLSHIYIQIDRVKVINGMCSSTTTSTDETENIHLLNVLNWSPLESIITTNNKPKTENDFTYKNVYSAVQLSIELQKKMLK